MTIALPGFVIGFEGIALVDVVLAGGLKGRDADGPVEVVNGRFGYDRVEGPGTDVELHVGEWPIRDDLVVRRVAVTTDTIDGVPDR